MAHDSWMVPHDTLKARILFWEVADPQITMREAGEKWLQYEALVYGPLKKDKKDKGKAKGKGKEKFRQAKGKDKGKGKGKGKAKDVFRTSSKNKPKTKGKYSGRMQLRKKMKPSVRKV